MKCPSASRSKAVFGALPAGTTGQESRRREPIVFHFSGPYGSGKRLLAQAICHELKSPLLLAEADKMAAGQVPLEEALWLLGREAVLQSAALCIQDFDSLLADDKQAFLVKSLLEVTKTFSLDPLSSRPSNLEASRAPQ